MTTVPLTLAPGTLRRCTKCKEEKDVSVFKRDSRKTGGLSSWCQACSVIGSAAWQKRNRPEVTAYQLEWSHNLKARAYAKLGNKCSEPGCAVSDVRCLQIDHVNNDGHLDRRPRKARGAGRDKVAGQGTTYLRIIKDTVGRFQLLCANHNAIKAWEHRQAQLRAASQEQK